MHEPFWGQPSAVGDSREINYEHSPCVRPRPQRSLPRTHHHRHAPRAITALRPTTTPSVTRQLTVTRHLTPRRPAQIRRRARLHDHLHPVALRQRQRLCLQPRTFSEMVTTQRIARHNLQTNLPGIPNPSLHPKPLAPPRHQPSGSALILNPNNRTQGERVTVSVGRMRCISCPPLGAWHITRRCI